MALCDFRFSDRARAAFDTHFGLFVARSVDLNRMGENLKPIRKEMQKTLATPSEAVDANLGAFDRYFEAHHHRSPLRQQRAHFQKSGIPGSNPIVTLLLLVELKHGVLIGIQDAEAIRSPLEFDVLAHVEAFEGMRGKVHCSPGEPVLRDAEGIIASLFQGPDKRTQVHPGSRDIAAFVFAVPGTGRDATAETLQSLELMTAGAAGSVQAEIHSTGAA
jgi:hypothetical protein